MDNSHKTAISRRFISAPARHLKINSLLVGRALDYGCGRGKDCDVLDIEGIDPYWTDGMLKKRMDRHGFLMRGLDSADRFDTIMCNFVLNVIEDGSERQAVLDKIKWLLAPGGKAYISVRNDRKKLNGLTKKGTWQGFIELDLPVVKKTGSFIMYLLEK